MSSDPFPDGGFPTWQRPIVCTDEHLTSVTDLARVLHHLTLFEAPDAQQDEVRRQMVAFAAEHPDALHRSCGAGHFTGSALVVDPSTDRVLVLFHRKLQRWLQPGGHADGNANMPATALREATEETGIDGLRVVLPVVDLDIHEVRPPGEPAHLHLDLRFLVLAPARAMPTGNHESEALRWVAFDELPDVEADAGLTRLAERGLALARRV